MDPNQSTSRRKTVDGVIYLHRVSNSKPNHSFNLFKSLCGENTLDHVVVVTNMWSEIPDEEERRSLDEKSIFRRALTENSSLKIFRHDDTPDSARRILDALIKQYSLLDPPGAQTVDDDLVCNAGCFGGLCF